MTDVNPLLNSTSAGQIAQKLDAADGTKDGKINASIWNEFVEDKGGKKIKESIDVVSAMNSITTYVVREAKKAGKNVEVLAQEWAGGIKSPEGAAAASGSEAVEGEGNKANPAGSGETGTVNSPVKKKEEQIQADYNNVKVTVPKKEVESKSPANKEEVDNIVNAMNEAEEVANKILEAYSKIKFPFLPRDVDNMENALKLINKDNVIYVLEKIPNLIDIIDGVDAMGYGFDKDEVIKYVLTPLGLKGDEYGWGADEGEERISLSEFYKERAANWSLEEIKEEVNKVSADIRQSEQNKIDEDIAAVNEETAEVEEYNKTELPKAQKVFDDANRFLAEVANMEPKPEIESGHNEEGDWKAITLPDGRWIEVRYNSEGEISKILISHDTSPNKRPDGSTFDGADISYEKDIAEYDTDKNNDVFDGSITSGYDFERLKALAEKIFGKNE